MPRNHTDPTVRTGLQYQHLDYDPQRRNDCAPRAWAKVTGESYTDVYDELTSYNNGADIAKSGTFFMAAVAFADKRGWVWVGQERTFVLKKDPVWGLKSSRSPSKLLVAENLPKCPVVALTRDHSVAVIDHVLYDSFDTRGKRSRRLEGYFIKKSDLITPIA